MYMVGASDSTKIHEYDLSTAWDISTAGHNQTQTVAGGNVTGIFIDSNGIRLYTIDNTGDLIRQFDLSTEWDISTETLTTSYSVAAQENSPLCITTNGDGSQIFIGGSGGNGVDEFTLAATEQAYSFISFPESFNAKVISEIGAFVYEEGAGSGTFTEIALQKRTITDGTAGSWTNVLSTNITIDAQEFDSRDAATPAVIDTDQDDIVSKNQYRVKINSVSDAGVKGLGIWIDVA